LAQKYEDFSKYQMKALTLPLEFIRFSQKRTNFK